MANRSRSRNVYDGGLPLEQHSTVNSYAEMEAFDRARC